MTESSAISGRIGAPADLQAPRANTQFDSITGFEYSYVDGSGATRTFSVSVPDALGALRAIGDDFSPDDVYQVGNRSEYRIAPELSDKAKRNADPSRVPLPFSQGNTAPRTLHAASQKDLERGTLLKFRLPLSENEAQWFERVLQPTQARGSSIVHQLRDEEALPVLSADLSHAVESRHYALSLQAFDEDYERLSAQLGELIESGKAADTPQNRLRIAALKAEVDRLNDKVQKNIARSEVMPVRFDFAQLGNNRFALRTLRDAIRNGAYVSTDAKMRTDLPAYKELSHLFGLTGPAFTPLLVHSNNMGMRMTVNEMAQFSAAYKRLDPEFTGPVLAIAASDIPNKAEDTHLFPTYLNINVKPELAREVANSFDLYAKDATHGLGTNFSNRMTSLSPSVIDAGNTIAREAVIDGDTGLTTIAVISGSAAAGGLFWGASRLGDKVVGAQANPEISHLRDEIRASYEGLRNDFRDYRDQIKRIIKGEDDDNDPSIGGAAAGSSSTTTVPTPLKAVTKTATRTTTSGMSAIESSDSNSIVSAKAVGAFLVAAGAVAALLIPGVGEVGLATAAAGLLVSTGTGGDGPKTPSTPGT